MRFAVCLAILSGVLCEDFASGEIGDPCDDCTLNNCECDDGDAGPGTVIEYYTGDCTAPTDDCECLDLLLNLAKILVYHREGIHTGFGFDK